MGERPLADTASSPAARSDRALRHAEMRPTAGRSPVVHPTPVRQAAVYGLALAAAVIGVWALVAPASFAGDFGLTVGWVAADGPYNEHLVLDVGGLYLALGLLTVGLGRRRDAGVDRLLGAAWLVTAVPHFAYHVGHLAPFPLVDAWAQMVLLATTVACALVLTLRRPSGRAVAR